MKKEEFYFDSRDEITKIHAVRYTPDTDRPRAVLQIIHGMSEYIERYEPFIEIMVDKGFVVVGEDHLGHGLSVAEGSVHGYFCKKNAATVVVRDVHRLKKLTQEIYPDIPYVIMGHSMGSFIARNYIAMYGSGIDAAIIMGTGNSPMWLINTGKFLGDIMKPFCNPYAPSNVLNKIAFSTYNGRIENPRTDFDWLTKDETIVDKYMADEKCGFVFTINGFDTMFTFIARSEKKSNLSCVPKTLPVLFISGNDDPVGNYGEDVKKAYEALRAAGVSDVTLKLYPGDRHEILNETDKDAVISDLYDWIVSKI